MQTISQLFLNRNLLHSRNFLYRMYTESAKSSWVYLCFVRQVLTGVYTRAVEDLWCTYNLMHPWKGHRPEWMKGSFLATRECQLLGLPETIMFCACDIVILTHLEWNQILSFSVNPLETFLFSFWLALTGHIYIYCYLSRKSCPYGVFVCNVQIISLSK